MARGWAGSIGAAAALTVLAPAFPVMAQVCRAPAPAAGQTVSGPVLHVIDGRTLCVAQGPTPEQWVPLRVSSSPDVARERLMAAAFSQPLRCTITGGRGAVAIAACTLGGRPLVDLLQASPTVTQAATWR